MEPWPITRIQAVLTEHADLGEEPEWADIQIWTRWFERRGITLLAVLLLLTTIVWKALFLSHLYFRQDDFLLLDRAWVSPLSWSALTSISAGHLIPGPYLLAWLETRISLYNWGLATVVNLGFVAAAGLAALRLLRTLFGNRAAILVPLAIYLLCPLTFPDLGFWSSALESLPLQLAIFMGLSAHVNYIRTARLRHLGASVFWVLFGLFCSEKGLILPLLLFAVTVAFLMGGDTLPGGLRRCVAKFWKAWLVYSAMVVGYSVLLAISLNTSAARLSSPGSTGRVLTFIGSLIKDTFIPGSVGGPWQWHPVPGASYAYTSAPASLVWLTLIVAALVILASLFSGRSAWRAWVILGGWIILADVLPVVIDRASELVFDPNLLGRDANYVADAVAVLAVCVGLAFWPVTSTDAASAAPIQMAPSISSVTQARRTMAALAFGAFVMGSIWSVQAYENSANGATARTFIANARRALQETQAGSVIVDRQVPADIVTGTFGNRVYASTVIGEMARGALAMKLRWIRNPVGTYDHLFLFGNDGKLHLAAIDGTGSLAGPDHAACWPVRNGQVAVSFYAPSSPDTTLLRLGYLLGARSPETVNVGYAGTVTIVRIEPGLHSLYIPEHGTASGITIAGFGHVYFCVGDAEAGHIAPAVSGVALPPKVP